MYIEGGVVLLGIQVEEENITVWMFRQPIYGLSGERNMRAFEEVASVFFVAK